LAKQIPEKKNLETLGMILPYKSQFLYREMGFLSTILDKTLLLALAEHL
jgi:hypothetical protein